MNIVDERPYALLPQQEVSPNIQHLEEMIGQDLVSLFHKFQAIDAIPKSAMSDTLQDEERRALAKEVDAALFQSLASFNLAIFQLGFIVTLCRRHRMHRFLPIEGEVSKTFDDWLFARNADTRNIAFAERAYRDIGFAVELIGREAFAVLPNVTDDTLKALAHVRRENVRQSKIEAKQIAGYDAMPVEQQNYELQRIQKEQEHIIKAAVISAIQSPQMYNKREMNDKHGIVTKTPITCKVVFNADGSKATLTASVTREELEGVIGDNQFFLVFDYYKEKGLTAGQLKTLLEEEDLQSE